MRTAIGPSAARLTIGRASTGETAAARRVRGPPDPALVFSGPWTFRTLSR